MLDINHVADLLDATDDPDEREGILLDALLSTIIYNHKIGLFLEEQDLTDELELFLTKQERRVLH